MLYTNQRKILIQTAVAWTIPYCMLVSSPLGQSTAQIVPQVGHYASHFEVTEDDRYLISASNRDFKIWDLQSASLSQSLVRTTFVGNGDSKISDIDASSNSNVIVAVVDGAINVWDFTSGERLFQIDDYNGEYTSFAFVELSGAGQTALVTTDDGRVIELSLFSERNPKVVFSHPKDEAIITSFTLREDVNSLFIGDNEGVATILSLSSWSPRYSVNLDQAPVNSIAVSSDGELFAIGGDSNETRVGASAHVFQVDDGTLVAASEPIIGIYQDEDPSGGIVEHHFNVFIDNMDFLPDKSELVIFTNSGSYYWDTSGNRTVPLWDELSFASAPVQSAKSIVSNNDLGAFALFSNDGLQPLSTIGGLSQSMYYTSISPDGAMVAAIARNSVGIWSLRTGSLLYRRDAEPSSAFSSIEFSPDSGRLIVQLSDNSDGLFEKGVLESWSSTDFQVEWRTTYERYLDGCRGCQPSIGFNPERGLVELEDDDDTLKLFDLGTGDLVDVVHPQHDLPAGALRNDAFIAHDLSAAFQLYRSDRRDEEKFYFDFYLSTVDFDARDAAELEPLPPPSSNHRIEDAKFSPSGQYIITLSVDEPDGDDASAADVEETIVSFIPVGGEFIGKTVTVPGYQFRIDFTNDGRFIVLKDTEGFVLIDIESAQVFPRLALQFSSSRASHYEISGENGHYVSAGDDGLLVADSATGRQLMTALMSDSGEWITLTPEGFFDGSDDGRELLNVVRDLEIYSLFQFEKALFRPDLLEELLSGDTHSRYENEAYFLNLDRILSSGPAPQIRLLEGRTITEGDTARVSVRLTDAGGGIGSRIEWRVPGGARKGDSTPAILANVTDVAVVVEAELPLERCLEAEPCGPAEYEVVAFNKAGLSASQPLKFYLDPRGASTKAPPKLHILAIGVEKYQRQDLELRYPVDDAVEFSAALESVARANDTDGVPLYGDVAVVQLHDDQVTKENIEDEFRKMVVGMKPQDVFVLFLAGHGRTVGPTYYFLPHDIPSGGQIRDFGVGQDDWDDWLGTLPALKTLVVIDTCEAGSASTLVRGNAVARRTAFERLKSASGNNLIAAARASDPALEGYMNHGVLTYSLLEALDADLAGSAPVTVGDLANHAYQRVPELALLVDPEKVQYPIRRLSGGEFPLGIRVKVLGSQSQHDADPESDARATYVTVTAIPLKQQPDWSSDTIEVIENGTPIVILNERNGWLQIQRKNGSIGYLPRDTVKRQD